MATPQAIQEKLAREVLRKLRLATAADEKEGRQIICQEVFTDITGTLDEGAQEKLATDRKCRFYEVLAPFFKEKGDSAEALLYVSRQLWGQPYMAPIFALLLHQWLFRAPDAGGTEQRQKHINVLASGARQLFWGDAHASLYNFQPLFNFLADAVVLSPDRRRLDSLPRPSRSALLAVVASFLPYYSLAEDLGHMLEVFPSPDHTLDEGGHVGGESADYVIVHFTETLRLLKPEQSLLAFLSALVGLKGCPYLSATRSITRLRLQAELYSLTTVGGPRYPPKSVNVAAFRALDALFPSGG
ncbi:hypothetical protein WJX72_002897 [[Myrmecia] bisecta]|uniref:Uncharacterized protein n=1 Tax=[Myrmecia] bisecta TaxID=41462 RepID=A0AAW1PKH0_9CHLO